MAVTAERLIEAAGGVLWRPAEGGLGVEVALVHRPKYDDWSVPKGKLLPGEHPLLAALREVEEETGYVGRLGRALGEVRYLKDGVPKRVRYWAIEAVDGAFISGEEVDQLMWLPPREARLHLQPERDRPIIDAFMADVRPTRSCVVVRHGSAGERAAWTGDDRERPLDLLGHQQALALVPVLDVLGARRVLSADVLRCLDTVGPFAVATRLTVESEPLLSESGYSTAPEAALDRLLEVLLGDEPVVVCSQGKAIPPLLRRAGAMLGLRDLEASVPKGGFAVLHLADGFEPVLTAFECFPPVA